MAFSFSDISPELTRELTWWYRHATSVGTRPLRSRELENFYHKRPRRGVGSAIQYELTFPRLGERRWIPPVLTYGIHSNRHVCGKWTRDVPFTEDGKAPRFGSIERSEAQIPFSCELLDYTRTVASLEVPEPLTCACTITRLPTEVIQQILAHILPTGCAFQFFLGRQNSEKVSCVQKFVRESHSGGYATGSTDLAAAKTCQRLRDEAHMLFFGRNTFVFHLTNRAVRPFTRVTKHGSIRAWTRVIPSHAESIGLGPLSSHAAFYLCNVALVVSISPSHTSSDVQELLTSVERASAVLERSKKLRSLAIDFPEPRTLVSRNEITLAIEALKVELKDGQISLASLFPPERESLQTKILKPLFREGSSVKAEELVFGESVNDESKQKLRLAFESGRQKSVSGQAENEAEIRGPKRQKV